MPERSKEKVISSVHRGGHAVLLITYQNLAITELAMYLPLLTKRIIVSSGGGDDLIRLDSLDYHRMAFVSHPGRPIGILDIVKAGLIRISTGKPWQAPIEVILCLAPRCYLVLAHKLGVRFPVAFVPPP